ncbi:MAG: hypothetical protein MZV70_40030 [Desulfobacterales bacterium]|nr:hypothetical protein [Desulfobacterales bacterium]
MALELSAGPGGRAQADDGSVLPFPAGALGKSIAGPDGRRTRRYKAPRGAPSASGRERAERAHHPAWTTWGFGSRPRPYGGEIQTP